MSGGASGAPLPPVAPADSCPGRSRRLHATPRTAADGLPTGGPAALTTGDRTMRNLLAFTAAAALTVAGLGWYLGWYRIHSAQATDGHRNVNIDINTDKITDDIQRAEKKILERANEHAQPAKDKADQRGTNPNQDAANLVPPR